MSSSTIKKILSVLGWISLVGMAILGAKMFSEAAPYDKETLMGFLGFLIGAIVGFGSLIMCFAIGNALADLERAANATEEIAYHLKRGDSSVSRNAGSLSTISRLSAINRDETYVSATWTCKKCGRVNEKSNMTCKDCGEYK